MKNHRNQKIRPVVNCSTRDCPVAPFCATMAAIAIMASWCHRMEFFSGTYVALTSDHGTNIDAILFFRLESWRTQDLWENHQTSIVDLGQQLLLLLLTQNMCLGSSLSPQYARVSHGGCAPMLLKSLIKHLKTAKPNQVYANAEGGSASSLLGQLLHYVTLWSVQPMPLGRACWSGPRTVGSRSWWGKPSFSPANDGGWWPG